jgi:hypothetical protein
MTASYDFAMCIKKIEVEPYIEATSKPHTLLASYSGYDMQQGRLLGPVRVPGP